ncbi:hypothetical protein LTR56_016767 [Elasticomyces elasticus]|nr:hypothetical protein LTR56_016767 [Elasticomyces elasticus]KAK3644898.1 hypothetical protein LTR22_015044 [Elasticomyces elasticus]KAK4923367.1 hypothetical protein LTR49_009437 [Elasticomyces elasticus]KAK5753272.1 hypothetical protein LTS12_016608 [Elasticomyces elasticus]
MRDFKKGFTEGYAAGQNMADRIISAQGQTSQALPPYSPTSPIWTNWTDTAFVQSEAGFDAKFNTPRQEVDPAIQAQIDERRRWQELVAKLRRDLEDQVKEQERHATEQAQREQAQAKAKAQAQAETQARDQREAKQQREAFAQAETLRKHRQWDAYQKGWESFDSLTTTQVRLKTLRDLITWPSESGRFPVCLEDKEIQRFFLECSSCCDSASRMTLLKERNRWHPDKMGQRMRQKGKEIDDETLTAITAISQILNALCATKTKFVNAYEMCFLHYERNILVNAVCNQKPLLVVPDQSFIS